MKIGFKYYLLIFCVFSLALGAQQLRFKHITNEDGLSSLMVNCILQDDKGFMWFGTQDGLNRYDGYQFKVYKNDPTDLNSLNSSEITAVNQIRPDLMVIGTREGLNYFNPVNETFTSLRHLKPLKSKINCIIKADEKNAWIGCEDGLFLLNIEQKTIRNYEFVVKQKISVNAIAVLKGKVFVGTNGDGLWLIDHGNASKVDFTDEELIEVKAQELDVITDIKEYAGKLYLGTYGYGIFKMDDSGELEKRIWMVEGNKPDGGNFIKKMDIRDSKMYVASTYGFFICNLLSEKILTTIHKNEKLGDQSLSGEKIESLFIDKVKNIWVGFSTEGINVSFFQAQKFPEANNGLDLSIGNIYAFCEDANENLMIGGVQTLHYFDKHSNLKKNLTGLLKGGAAICIYNQDPKFYWIGTWGNGLYRLNVEMGEFKQVISNKEGGTILCLVPDGEGNLYAGTVGDGYFKVNMQDLSFEQFKNDPALKEFNINAIYQDRTKHVWLGTYDGGLMKTEGFPKNGKFHISKIYKNEGKAGDIASNTILAMNEDLKGNIWFATSAGVSRLAPNGKFVSYYEKDGLANAYLYSILRDSIGHFWMSCNKGLIKFNPLLPEKDIIFRNYDVKDGLINSEHNSGAALLGTSGKMYFGGSNGFNAFRPAQIKDNFNAPGVYVVSYQRGGLDVPLDSSITYKKNIELEWRENYLQFEVVALDYTDPSKNKFKFMLEGYDKDWSAPSNVRYISYTQLSGGDYTFKVKAANNDGVWNETPFEIKISVIPPFWKTKIFYVLVVLIIIAGVYGFTQYRTKSIMRENKILENRVEERTKELAEKNRDITSSIEYAKRIQEAILPSQDDIFKKLKGAFILYKPKDIVSGDFYWFGEKNNQKVFAVVDCTGHGVPGAFMSMIGHNLLNQIVLEKGITAPDEVLNNLHKGVQDALRQGQNEITTNDGMDLSLITFNDQTGEIHWAGANRPLVMVSNKGEFNKIEGDKYPVGGAQINSVRKFTKHEINVSGPTMLYLFSDGYADQFGGDRGKKFMVKKYYDVLKEIHLKFPEEQKQILLSEFETWRKNHEQVDDVLVAGIAI
ncbi:MAG: SpoIIE family protein phosphatase [Sphingobacteriaceae bacterium]|nr:SpoIIE family protein phosphatase [Sphingobacteriaceae bacterium]